MPKIVVPIKVERLDNAIQNIQKAEEQQPDVLELRLDYMPADRLNEKTIDILLQCCDLPVIATIRHKSEAGKGEGYDGPEEKRIELIGYAIERGAAYVDMEAMQYSNLDKRDTKIILSNHNHVETPSNALEIYRKFVVGFYPKRADILKFAFRISPDEKSAEQDVENIVSIIERANKDGIPIAAMAMAPKIDGEIPEKMKELVGRTRLHAGNELAYACLSKQERTAPGQYTVAEMKELLGK
ncbi:type I 3-dehydroquinate dehydratase [Candidatus Woesearchaeota archaeon]|nr:type I 3-dehydroquinate dehydratase [Candidatus Woesearchaeota archaeon]